MDSEFQDLIHCIIKQDENTQNALQSFIVKTDKVFSFPFLNENNLRLDLWNSLYKIANDSADEQIQTLCCTAVKILSREKNNLKRILDTTDWLGSLKKFSGLDDIDVVLTEKSKVVAMEAQKCLCNLVFNSISAASQCSKNGILLNANERIKKFHKDPSFSEEMKLFDVKLIFIISAVLPETRILLREQENAVINLMEFLEYILVDDKFSKESSVNLACEILKALFNITVQLKPNEEQSDNYKKLVTILRKYLIYPIEYGDKSSLQNNVVNLLTNIPNTYYLELITPLTSNDDESYLKQVEFNGYDMSVFKVILQLLRAKIAVDNPVGQQLERISPTATVLYKGACASPAIRKYLRSEILPPLKDFYTRPEEGTTLRNYLCRLLTTPVTDLRDIIAEFIFVLCKKNVKRMIKYTGYGNAAGLLAQKGLLGGQQAKEAAEFSSDSEDSETEEYAEIKHNINPVLGCYEPSHPDVMAGMTEEQKEYEAMKIINLMDALTRKGTIKPCKIDENGKPVPIEHVLELQSTFQKKEKFDKSDD